MKILLVDDSKFVREVVKSILKNQSFITQFFARESGKKALELLKTEPIDVMILDLEMPGMSGIEVIQSMRQSNRDTQILIFSSFARQGDQRVLDALAAGANDFLMKPTESIGENSLENLESILIPKMTRLFQDKKKDYLPSDIEFPDSLLSVNPKAMIIGFTVEHIFNIVEILSSVKKLDFPIFLIHPELDQLSHKILEDFYKISGVSISELRSKEFPKVNKFYVVPNGKYLSFDSKNQISLLTIGDKSPQDIFTKSIETGISAFGENLVYYLLFKKNSSLFNLIPKKDSSIKLIYTGKYFEEKIKTILPNVFDMQESAFAYYINEISTRDVKAERKPIVKKIIKEGDIFDFLAAKTSNDLSLYKQNVMAAIVSRMNKLEFNTIDEYYDYVCNDEKECDLLVSKVTNHSTRFFRHKKHFEYLIEQVRALDIHKLKIISIGCSTGEEVYGLAMTMQEISESKENFDYSIDAFDVDQVSLDTARTATYGLWSLKRIPEKYHKYIQQRDGKIIINPDLVKKCRFSKKDVFKEFTGVETYNFIFCRYVLMYFDETAHAEIMKKLSKSIDNNGSLFIGMKETINHPDFEVVETGIYKKK